MTEQPDPSADGTGLASVGEILTEHAGRAPGDGQQAGAQPQEGGLAGAVRAAQEHDLTGRDLQIDPGQCGKAAEERHRAAELDDRFHGVHEVYGALSDATNAGGWAD